MFAVLLDVWALLTIAPAAVRLTEAGITAAGNA
jgi:hypothetical protein